MFKWLMNKDKSFATNINCCILKEFNLDSSLHQ